MPQKTSIIIPCYNEELRLPKEDIFHFLKQEDSIHLCFTNDGSTDKTMEVLKSIKEKFPETVSIIDLKKNSGKAEAVRHSMIQLNAQNTFDFIGYFDADLATPLSQIKLVLDGFNKRETTILCMGSRVKRLGTQITRKPTRHYLGRIFATTVSIALNIPVYDSQCGAKIFRASAVNDIFKEHFISKWIFDVEVLMRIKNLYGVDKINQYIREVPLEEWQEIGNSKIGFKGFIKAPAELTKIYLKYRRALN
jgi:dolichyl-phosphate beta-glucosyltransferase